MQRKPSSKATPAKARSSIPVIPAMRGFSFLTGDVNWKEYGGTFYRSFGDGTYALIEFINLEDTVGYGGIRGNKYAVVRRTVDLSPGGFSLRNLDSALRTIGASPATRDPRVILDAVNAYGSFDVDFELFGNNADRLLAEAKRR
jgi:hypothetical protein